VFQYNPATGDRRISGSFASLAGLEAALEARDEALVQLAIERILLGHALICGFGGVPLLYMGDEIGLRNDYGYLRDPDHATDNRWLHRPAMDWDAVARRRLVGSVEQRLFEGLRAILRARKRTPQLHATYPTEVLETHPHVFVTLRRHPLGPTLALYNLTESHQSVPTSVLFEHGLAQAFDQLDQRFVDTAGPSVHLAPYQRLWLV
jgi:amylosucrase